jgi:tetratricopeptide (TPR) repeat protein
MRGAACAILIVCLGASCSRSARLYLERGDALFHAGKYSEAEFQYRVSLSKDTHFAEAYYRLGLTDIELNRNAAALVALQRAVTFAPGNQLYAIKLADLSLETYQSDPVKKLYDQAEQEAYDLLRQNPSSFDGLRLHGEVLIIDRKYDEALAELRKADAIRPLDPAANVPILQVLLTQNRTQEAETLSKRVLEAHRDSAATYELMAGYYMNANRAADAERMLQSEIAALPARINPRLQLASLYRDAGRREEMAATLDRIRQDGARFPDAPRWVGDFYAANGAWQDALRQYQDGDRLDPKERLLYEKGAARALAALGQTKDAIDELTTVLKANPGDSNARLARAILWRDSSSAADRNLAITDLKSLCNASPNDVIARYNLGLAYVANGDITAATKELKVAAGQRADYAAPRIALAELAERTGDHAGTIRLTEEVLATDPDNRDAALLHASGLIGNQDYSRARAELEDLLRSQPDSVDVNLRLAVLNTAEQKYADAEAGYLRLYQPGSNDPRPLQGLIHLYLKEKQLAKADRLLERELAKDSGSREVHRLAAETALQEGNRTLAIQRYEWLRDNDPNSVEVLRILGGLYRDRGDLQRAIASYQKASELAPRDEDLLSNLAVLEGKAGEMPAAIATLKKELALNPNNAAAMNNLAFDLAETETDLDHALTLAATAARQLSDNPDVLDTLGWVYVKHGLNQSAIQVFRLLVKKSPDLPVYRYHLGVAFLQDHQLVEAKAEFATALSKNPPKDLAQKIRQADARL